MSVGLRQLCVLYLAAHDGIHITLTILTSLGIEAQERLKSSLAALEQRGRKLQ
jgi:hypothetical protein